MTRVDPSGQLTLFAKSAPDPDGVEAAVNNAVAQANRTLRNLDWFEVKNIRGHLADGAVADWQVTIKLGFRIEE